MINSLKESDQQKSGLLANFPPIDPQAQLALLLLEQQKERRKKNISVRNKDSDSESEAESEYEVGGEMKRARRGSLSKGIKSKIVDTLTKSVSCQTLANPMDDPNAVIIEIELSG